MIPPAKDISAMDSRIARSPTGAGLGIEGGGRLDLGERRGIESTGSTSGSAPAPRRARAGPRSTGTSVVAGAVAGAVVSLLVSGGLRTITPDRPVPAPVPVPVERLTIDVPAVLAAVGRSVVAIEAERADPSGILGSTGTGLVVSADEGLILINAHVVAGASSITVRFVDGSQQPAEVVKRLPLDDVALVKVSRTKGLVAAELGSSGDLKVGEAALAIGYALDLRGSPTVTVGIVSAVGRRIDSAGIHLRDLIQTDAAVNAGTRAGRS